MAGATLAARGVGRSFGAYTVLHGIDLRVSPGQRIGIVGPNGVGKSTLLRLLAGHDQPDEGSIECRPRTATVGLLDQERPMGPETVRELLERRTGVAAADKELNAAASGLAAPDATPADDQRYADALDRFLALGGADLVARAETVFAEIGLASDLLDQCVRQLSGGQGARVDLAALLLSRFDVLLLDEPTNDLDFAGLAVLESWVERVSSGVVLVSHDRAFLERVVTDVVELDEFSRTGTHYGGGWVAFQEERSTARRHAEEAYREYEGKRQNLTDRGQREREWSTVGVKKVKRSGENDKHVKHFRSQSSEQLAGKAKRTEQAMARLTVVESPREAWQLHLDVASAPPAGARALELVDVTVDRGGFVLGPIDLVVASGDRVAITGSNGAGKSTLLSVLLGDVEPTGGVRRMGPGVRVGVIGQRRDRFIAAPTLRRAFIDETGLERSEAQSLLAKFGLGGDDIERPPAELSPGERTRAELALLMAVGVNCLVLDEPSNHLDLPALEQLELALTSFRGALLLVTHDRTMLSRVPLHRMLRLDAGKVVSDELVSSASD